MNKRKENSLFQLNK